MVLLRSIQNYIHDIDIKTKAQIVDYVRRDPASRCVPLVDLNYKTYRRHSTSTKIPTGLILQGSRGGFSEDLTQGISSDLNRNIECCCIAVQPGPNLNLKALLKSLNQAAKILVNSSIGTASSDIDEAVGVEENVNISCIKLEIVS